VPVLFGIGLFCLPANAQETKKIPINVGYSTSSTEVDQRDADAALKVWAKEIGDTYGFEAKTTLYPSVEELVKDFVGKKLDYCSMHTTDYLKYASVLKVPAELARARNNRNTVKYLLLVPADKAIKGLADLKGKKLAIKKANHLGMMFLDVELMKAKMPKSDHFFSDIQEKTKENQVALAVFFNQADACIVTDMGFATMTELNPQIGKKLKAIVSSPDFVDSVGFFSRNYPQAYKEKAIEGIMKGAKASKRAKQMMLLFNTDSMEVITGNQLDSVRTLLADYNRLKGFKQ
jgi:ABC-type phosphate/phosphonate transport system substrate-binding protein